MLKKFFPLVFLFVVSIPLVFPFFAPGYFSTHDGEWAVIRLAEMDREIRDGQIPPRWADYLNHGFGYPLFLFTYPGPYYFGEIFHLLGIGLVGSLKLLFILSVLLSGCFMYLLGRQLWGTSGGLVSAIFYLYAPFRLVNLFVRGSVGESLSFALFPLIFYLGINLCQNPSKKWLVLVSLSLAGLILTHNVMAIIFIPLWLLFLLLIKRSILVGLKSLGLGLGLSAFFWLPALIEKKYIILSQVPLSDISRHFVNLSQLVKPSWSFDTLPSFQLGWVHLVFFFISFSIFLWFSHKRELTRLQIISIMYSLAASLFLILLMLPISYPVWKLTPFLREIDFPWRLLGPVSFFFSLPVGILAYHGFEAKTIKSWWLRFFLVFICFSIILANIGYAKPKERIDKGDNYYRSNDATTTSAGELMPVWVKEKPKERPSKKVELLGSGKIGTLFFNSKKIEFSVEAEHNLQVKINTVYFPGWKIWVDGKEMKLDYNNPEGLLTFSVEKGSHWVFGKFTRTPIRVEAEIITLIALALIFWLTLPFLRIKRAIK